MNGSFPLADVSARCRALALLAATSVLAGPGCLLTSQQDFPDPTPTAPFLEANTAMPPLEQMVIVDDDMVHDFIVKFRSEDDQRNVYARLIADSAPNDAFGIQQIPPNRPGEQERTIDFAWSRKSVSNNGAILAPGCHTMKIVVSHEFAPFQNVPTDPTDVDFVVWWVLVGDAKNPVASLLALGCPSTQQRTSTSSP